MDGVEPPGGITASSLHGYFATPKTTLAAASVAVELSYNKKIDKALTHHCVRSSLAAQASES